MLRILVRSEYYVCIIEKLSFCKFVNFRWRCYVFRRQYSVFVFYQAIVYYKGFVVGDVRDSAIRRYLNQSHIHALCSESGPSADPQ